VRRAFVGDVHGDLESFSKIYDLIKKQDVDEVWHCGDLVDRGPDPHGVVQFCIKNSVKGVLGNHDEVALKHKSSYDKHGKIPTKSADKQRTLLSLTDEDFDYLRSLPYLHVFDDVKLIAVHGGIHYRQEIWQNKPELLCRYQMVHPYKKHRSMWFNRHRDGTPESELRKQGWLRWYEGWDSDYSVVFGHTVFKDVMFYRTSAGSYCIGVDTGAVFGRKLSAVIVPDMTVVEVPNTPKYANMTHSGDDS
jgi:predicted phosphodiesterase